MENELYVLDLIDKLKKIFVFHGLNEDVSNSVSRNMVLAKLNGHDEHSINLIGRYIKFLNLNLINKQSDFEITQNHNIINVDGNKVFGSYVIKKVLNSKVFEDLNYHYDHVILKIKNLSHANYYKGIFLDSNIKDNYLFLFFSNNKGGKFVIPYNGTRKTLSTNTVCFGIGKNFIIDFVTTAITESKLHQHRNLNDWILNDNKKLYNLDRKDYTNNVKEFYGEDYGPLTSNVGIIFDHKKLFLINILCELFAGISTENGLSSTTGLGKFFGPNNGVFGIFIKLNTNQMVLYNQLMADTFKSQALYQPKTNKIEDNQKIILTEFEIKQLKKYS